MAGYTCSLCEGAEPATFLVTPLNGGDTMAIGQTCAPIALTGMLASYLDVDADQLWKAAERLVKHASTAQAATNDAGDQATPDSPPVTRLAPRRAKRAPAGAES